MKRLPLVLLGISACVQSSIVDSSNPAESQASAVSADITLEEVQAAIAANGAKWTAQATRISALPSSQRKAMLGAPLPQAIDARLRTEEEVATELPAQFDW